MFIDPIIGGALVGGVAQLFSGKKNRESVERTNQRQQAFTEKMYNKQHEDNIKLWNMQNEYNTPQAQMQRLKEAGLNPALAYGNASAGGSAGSVSSPDVKPVQFRTPEYNNMANTINTYFDAKIKQAQINNLQSQTTLNMNKSYIELDKQFGGINIFDHPEGQKFKYSNRYQATRKSELMESQLDALKESLRKIRAEGDIWEQLMKSKLHGSDLLNKIRGQEAKWNKKFRGAMEFLKLLK